MEPGSLVPHCPLTYALDHSTTTTHNVMVLIVGTENARNL